VMDSALRTAVPPFIGVTSLISGGGGPALHLDSGPARAGESETMQDHKWWPQSYHFLNPFLNI
jgi:hypothetical protein